MFTYGATGDLDSVAGSSGAMVALSHDGPLLTEMAFTGPVLGRVAYSYDADARVTSRSSGGFPVVYGYDADKLLTSAGPLSLTYDTDTPTLLSQQIGSIATTYGTDDFGEMTSMTTSVAAGRVHRLVLLRDEAGRITEERETILGRTTIWRYRRNAEGALERITRDGMLEEDLGYDVQGNRTRRAIGARLESSTYDAQDRLLTQGNWSLSWTPDGDLATRIDTAQNRAWSFRYDDLHELEAVTLPDGRNVSYVLDGMGRRIARAIDGVRTDAWLYGPAGNIIAEVDDLGSPITEFVYAGPIHAPAFMTRGGATYRYVTDIRGSVRLVIDTASGAVVQQIDYDRWGRVVSDTNPGFQPFGFASGLYDVDTGLVRFGARDYDPEIGRWTQKDPLGFAAGDTSLYVYGFGDPVSFVDPDGEFAFIPLIFLVIKAVDFAMNAWDTYQLIKRMMDPCISDSDKAAELALLAAQWLGGKVLGSLLSQLKKVQVVAKLGCFAAGTLVATSAGLVPIEMIEPGAIVQAWDETTNESEWRTVAANHIRTDVPTLAIGIEDENQGSWMLTTTAEHPIYVASVGYVPAARLEAGQWLVTGSGAWSRVVSVAATGSTETVYNLTVDGSENYFVGPSPVLVHNTRDCALTPKHGTFHVDPNGNVVPTPPGGRITGSPDGKFIQARDAAGNPTGVRIDGAHKPESHPDPRAQGPHGHVPGVTNPDGTPWLPINLEKK